MAENPKEFLKLLGDKMRQLDFKKIQIERNLRIFWPLLIMLIFPLFANENQSSIIAIKAGKIIRVTHPAIEKGTIIIEKDKIVAVGKDLSIPPEAEIINCPECFVFPGFIDTFTNLGLEDIEIEEQDSSETSFPITPQLRVIDALNPENRFIAFARKNGVTSALVAPIGKNIISGQSALINLAGKNPQEMLLKFPAAIQATLGEAPKEVFGKKGQMPATRMGEVALIRQTLIDTQNYEREKREGMAKKDLKLEALLPLIRGEIPLIIQANRMSDILTALKIAEEFNLKLIISQGAEAYRLAGELSAKRIPVLIGPIEDYFQRIETRGASYEAAKILDEAGVEIAFQTGDIRKGNNLIGQAKESLKYGLSYESALRALTINPARIFGLDKEIGSIEEGKLANLILFEADPLINVGKIKLVIIKGKVIS